MSIPERAFNWLIGDPYSRLIIEPREKLDRLTFRQKLHLVFYSNVRGKLSEEEVAYSKGASWSWDRVFYYYENLGDSLTLHIHQLPYRALRFVTDPRIVTLAITAILMFGVQWAFYPVETIWAVNCTIDLISPYLLPWAFKLATLISIEVSLFGHLVRTMSRFENVALLTHFEKNDK